MKRQTKVEQALSAQRKTIVDEFGALDAQLAPHRQQLRRYEDLSRLIRSWHADSDPNLGASSAGDLYEVVLGPCTMQTKIASASDVYKAIGHDKFLRSATVTLKALEQYADPAAVAALTVKERIGYRPIVVRFAGL